MEQRILGNHLKGRGQSLVLLVFVEGKGGFPALLKKTFLPRDYLVTHWQVQTQCRLVHLPIFVHFRFPLCFKDQSGQ